MSLQHQCVSFPLILALELNSPEGFDQVLILEFTESWTLQAVGKQLCVPFTLEIL
jgi:hypothetical protein